MEEYNDIPYYLGQNPDCPKCLSTMGYSYIYNKFKCPECGYEMDEEDLEFHKDVGCQACGCDLYPDCKDSCKMFD